jgi:hypothetical protein
VGTAVAEEVFPFEVRAFPNPSAGRLHVVFGKIIDEAEIRVLSIHGAEAMRQSVAHASAVEIDIRHLPAGNYLLELFHDGSAGVLPFIRQ